ncbi:CRISPR-associated endonuclease Cas3'' [Paracoccus shanxieyensis]|uniref:CRISPR-associated endonuclease Cas3 n=1 Tax=Paracoccus shanxieyensis TaxID=2675752 RepID=A0A6L6IYL1_9RHOB|nr:CRISPR-associated endonuclease Cas3'' [Paracoccus shanxieyensis]MTH65595.1 CRISPR-associated endonuclease Cas3'' [Paracoccus shanxieyensis]MTH88830.1 CRISPR-associated endonuclease Cas3'' [Paracoccus shanxieyensis]
MAHYAHSGLHDDRSDWQLLPDHLDNTAALAACRAGPLGLRAAAHMAGLFHDFGKYDPAFDRVLSGANEQVDHSTAGAALLCARVPAGLRPVAEIIAYAILGHHAGLPDRHGADSSMERRLDAFCNPIAPEIWDAAAFDWRPVAKELAALAGPAFPPFDLSVAARMVFSCLVDADFRDTEAFYARLNGTTPDRDWPYLAELLPHWTRVFDAHMAGFPGDGPINRLRAEILSHVRQGAAMAPGLFTLTVPTGGGKTLASMGFALDHAERHGHRRIIYTVPYTSIIDQTAAIFRGLFGDAVLEHHSAIDDRRTDLKGRDKLRLAMEDWAAPLVVTTNVQFFESLFAARPSRCRKLHNIAGSVIVLDEAQALPRKLLMPALRMIETLCAHYGCSVVLCTATQPAFDSRQLKQGGLPLEGRELAPDPVRLARELRRARIMQGGDMDDPALIEALRGTPQGMVIVNSRAHALELFNAAKAAGLDGLVHLTTRQYPVHRRAILDDIRARLKSGAPCRLIATSLIEAGVDLSFPKGWRAEAGLDSCVQAAGRVNRNGEWPVEDSTLTVFSAPGRSMPAEVKSLADAMRSIAPRHDDLLAPEAIRDWFEHVYWKAGANLGQKMASQMVCGQSGTDFPFRSMAQEFRMIDTTMVPVIIPGDAVADEAIRQLGVEDVPSGKLARVLQVYTVQVPAKARDLLIANGKAGFDHTKLRGDQFCVLSDRSLYHADSGLRWEHADYLSQESWLL